jgi:hypothetical protein
MRDKLIFYTVWTVVLGAALIGGFYVAERIVTWFSAAMTHILGG